MGKNCRICLCQEAKYSCPRCNVIYCGLGCYQSPAHSQCSEAFYKDWVQSELKNNDSNSKNDIVDILRRVNNQPELDSDDEEDLSSRLESVDLENPDAVWAALTPEERKDFQNRVSSGEIYSLVPLEEKNENILWWELYLPPKKVKEVGSMPDKLHSNLPGKVKADVEIDTSKSSPLVLNNLMNLLFAYVLTYRHLSWHLKRENECEFLRLMLDLSSNLSKEESFPSAQEALASGVNRATDSKLDSTLGRSDVEKMVKGPGEGYDKSLYVLAALSDLKTIVQSASLQLDKSEKFYRKKCFQTSKKIDFYICWVEQHK